MKKDTNKLRTRRGIKEYTYLGCPLTRNRSAWCFRMCTPDEEDRGRCGRLAPHSLKGSIQLGIEAHNRKRLEEHLHKLEHMYLKRPENQQLDPGISITQGQAEILFDVSEKFCDATGQIPDSLITRALTDVAFCAASSLVSDVVLRARRCDLDFLRPFPGGAMVARARLMGRQAEQIEVEAVLGDTEGLEIARGRCMFEKSEYPLSAEIGYVP